MGKDRSSVANTLRLLRLPLAVREQVASGALSMGHARALLGLDAETAIAKAAAHRRGPATVGPPDRGARQAPARAADDPRAAAVADVHTRAAEQELKLALGAPVRIVRARKGGRIEIDFKSEDDLQRLYEALNRR